MGAEKREGSDLREVRESGGGGTWELRRMRC